MTRSEIVQGFGWSFQFFYLPIVFVHFWKKTWMCFFSKMNKKNLAARKTKKPSESLENCTTSDAGIFNAHFLFLFKNENKKLKKIEKNIFFWKTLLHVRHQVWHQFGGLWIRGVHWRPLGPHLTPGCPLIPLNLLKVPTEITWF